ncbi:unnamed protein product [marine sediment metagenome]|uniref:Nucleoside 2-deoxyribosyltransferase n=1 Tax=marine sediment metagenome TaxID=412755 RepID=X1J8G4_9ZZZZ
MLTIYLSSPAPLLEWKKEIKEYPFSNKVKIYDPLRDGWGKKTYKRIEEAPKELVIRDLFELDRSDVVICYLVGAAGYKGFSFGTPCECMYAYLKGKIVIVVTKEDFVGNHPWVKFIATKVCSTVKEACDFIDEDFNQNFEVCPK